MNLYDITVPQFSRILGQVPGWFDKAKAHAEQKKFDPEVLLTARLAPDQFNLLKQVQIISDNAKGTSARIAGLEPPKFEDNEATIADLCGRIDKTIAYLKTLKREQFEGAAERRVPIFFMPGKYLNGSEYLFEFALPNFYFHATAAYSILRHNGVDIGKMDFLGPIQLRDL